MPTLRPQRLSGLVVIPTVELDGSIYRVSIAIDVGSSRVPPPEVVSREDLIAELRNSVEGSFEPIASPDPGPLPMRALRVVQARGEFTFSKGVNAPDELVVTVRGDRKSFPMSQTLTPTGGFSQEPPPGDTYSGTGSAIGPASVSGTGAAKGCAYGGRETPSCPPTDGVHLEFLGLIVDVCRGRVAAKRKWSVDL